MPRVCINRVICKFVFLVRLAIDAFDVKNENSKLIALGNASHGWYCWLIEVKRQLAIIEIFSQLFAKSLMCFKCVTKFFDSLVYNHILL
ncbi:hypothetical protein R3W88_031948 [Solanum pinnatisectum]|uniref:Uncharacterized protein n=1 Tax=Solanum pinnatisectum TaxID=50273 RepID=A0AAV9LMT9_9SOLN|nr:hypothetical protein R3W88_031948 [Solanum pinnatisectum]